jgi:acyl phosphate:glycerol-3-phosphate acyltransferase
MLAAMTTPVAATVAIVVGYLLGSIPVAVLIGRRRGVELRAVGDRNPGYWNAQATLGRRAAVPVFIGDLAKGVAAAGVARSLGGPWWIGYLGGGAAMVGHAWPVFAGFSGGRSILAFAGTVIVVAPLAAAIAVGACVVVTVVSKRFAWGARVAVFGFPVIQALLEARAHVAATGALMTVIGLRFAMAALADRRRNSISVRHHDSA